jgi:cell division septum initiation protein DivIVA
VHNLCLGQYDLVVKTGPSFTSRREEFVQFATEAVRADPSSAAIIMPEVWKQMDFAGADKIAKKFEQMEQGVIPPQAQQQMEEMGKQLEGVTGELEQTKAENQQLQMSQEAEMAKIQSQAQLQEQKIAGDMELQRMKFMAEMQLEREKFQAEMELERMKLGEQMELERMKAQQTARQKYDELNQNAQFEQTKIGLDEQKHEGAKAEKSAEKNEMKEMMTSLMKALTAPVEIVRDPKTNKATGTRRVLN